MKLINLDVRITSMKSITFLNKSISFLNIKLRVASMMKFTTSMNINYLNKINHLHDIHYLNEYEWILWRWNSQNQLLILYYFLKMKDLFSHRVTIFSFQHFFCQLEWEIHSKWRLCDFLRFFFRKNNVCTIKLHRIFSCIFLWNNLFNILLHIKYYVKMPMKGCIVKLQRQYISKDFLKKILKFSNEKAGHMTLHPYAES